MGQANGWENIDVIKKEQAMGECGCGETNPERVFKVGDFVLVVGRYWGCDCCDNPIGVQLDIFTPEEAESFDLTPSETFEPPKEGMGWQGIGVALIGKDDLVQAAEEMEEEFQEGGYDYWLKDYNTLSDFLKDRGLDLLQKAMAIRIAEEGAKKKKQDDSAS